MGRERKVKTYDFVVVSKSWRAPSTVYRCVDCRALTDEPKGHAKFHAGIRPAPPNPSSDEEWISIDVEIP